MTVRLGAVGAGWWATSNHFPIFAARDDVELVGVCGLGPELDTVRDQFGFGFSTGDYEQLLDADLDAVVITTPHDLHYEQAVRAIDRGLHVLVEKPVTLKADTAWDLQRRTAAAGVHFVVPYGWNYKPFTERAKALIDAGHLGELQYVQCHMASPTRGLFAGDPNDIRALWDSETSGPSVSPNASRCAAIASTLMRPLKRANSAVDGSPGVPNQAPKAAQPTPKPASTRSTTASFRRMPAV